jgi:thiosulfate/3-mercaptopyruvate sulfurtransferase
MTSIEDRGYHNSDILVSTDWVAERLEKAQEQTTTPSLRIVESNEDQLLYKSGHIPGAIEIDWTDDLNDPITRDYLDKVGFEQLMQSKGISNDTTVVFYGDKSNWWSAYALWVFQLFGHTKVKLMDGGRLKWQQENRPLVRETPDYPQTEFTAQERDDSTLRAFRDDVLAHVKANKQLVDVRSPEEFSGERLHIPGYPNEGALRGGHIPGARSIPWSSAANEDGTFKNASELKQIYLEDNGLNPDEEVIAYCRIGERSSHSWFVLRYLLGFENARNYDGSWTEWGNAVGVPIER